MHGAGAFEEGFVDEGVEEAFFEGFLLHRPVVEHSPQADDVGLAGGSREVGHLHVGVVPDAVDVDDICRGGFAAHHGGVPAVDGAVGDVGLGDLDDVRAGVVFAGPGGGGIAAFAGEDGDAVARGAEAGGEVDDGAHRAAADQAHGWEVVKDVHREGRVEIRVCARRRRCCV